MDYFFQTKSLSVHIGQERNDFMCCFWVTKLHLSLCDPMDCSMPGLPVLYISWSLLKFISIESVMLSNHLILCHPLLLLPSVFPSMWVFSNELTLQIRWPKYWSFNFSITPSNEYSELISFRIDWFAFLAVQGTLKSLLQHHNSKASIFGAQPSLWSNSHIHTWLLEKPGSFGFWSILWLYGSLMAK